MQTSKEISNGYKEYKKRKEESGQSPKYYANAKEAYQAHVARRGIESGEINLENVISGLNSRIDAWGKGVQGLSDDHTARFGDGVDRSSYRSDTSQWLEDVTGRRNQFDTEAEDIKSILRVYGNYLNNDYVKSVSDYLDGNKAFFDNVINLANSDNDYWSQWADEEAYNYYLKDKDFLEALQSGDLKNAERLLDGLSVEIRGEMGPPAFGSRQDTISKYRKALEYNKQKQEVLNYDTEAGEAELQQLEDALSQNEVSGFTSIAHEFWEVANLAQFGAEAPGDGKVEKYEELVKQFKEKRAHHEQMAMLKAQYTLTDNALNDSDFEKYAAQGESISNPTNRRDPVKNIATFARDYADIIRQEDSLVDGLDVARIDPKYTYMSEEEVKIYSYYLAKYGMDKAKEYLTSISSDLETREQNQIDIENAEFATKNLVTGTLASGVSVLTSLGSGLEYAGDALKYGIDSFVDPVNAEMDTNQLAHMTNVVRGAITDKVNLKIAGWDAFDFVYNAGMSGIDSAAASLIPGGGVVLGLSAAAQGTNDALERGMSSEQAFWNGAVQGVFEGLFESVSIGQFKNLQQAAVNGGKDIAFNIAKSMLVNASEETCTEVANILYDTIVNGEFANYTWEELEAGAWTDALAQIGEAAAMGAFTGAGFGGIASGSAAKRVSNVGKGFKTDLYEKGNSIGDITNEVLGTDKTKSKFAPNTEAYKRAEKIQTKLNSGGRVSNFSIGALAMNLSESQQISAVQSRLSAHVENKTDLSQMSRTIVDIMQGRKVSDKALAKVKANTYAFNALNDALGAKLKKGASIGDIKAAINNYQANASVSKQGGSTLNNKSHNSANFSVSENPDGGFDVIAEADGKSGSVANYGTKAQAQAAMYAMTLDMGAEGTRGLVMISGSLPDGANLGDAAQAFNAIYTQGRSGKAFSAVRFGETLTAGQRQYAYQLGVMDRALNSSGQKSFVEVLQNGTESDKIKENAQEGAENEQGEEGSELLRRNNVSVGKGHSQISSQGGRTSRDRNSSRIHKGTGTERVLSEDTERRKITNEIVSKISGTSVVDKSGRPILLYHATDKSFDTFAIGDIGFHFGSKSQADTRASAKNISQPRYVNAYLNIKNPLTTKSDYMNWHANSVALHLWNEGLISDAEKNEVVSLWSQGKNYDSPAAVKLREILENKGYDGIAYPNGYEGEGMSYIAFHDEQIVSAESSDADSNVQHAKENSIDPERIVYSSKKAMAYDAVAEDQLDGMHKKAFDIGKAIGRKVVVADTATSEGIPVDGFLGKDGVIYISKNNKSPVAFIFKHELTHFCERAGQKYRDFANAVRNSAAFKSWIKEKGYTSMLDYNSKLRQERASIGQDPGELGANNEIIGNFVGDMMFGDDTTLADRLIGELKPKERRSVKEFLRDFFGWIKSRLTGKNNTARTEIHRLEKMFAQAFRTAVNVEQESEERFSLSTNAKTELHKALYDLSYRSDVRLRDVTPEIMLQQKGVKNLPMVMKASHIRENVFSIAEAKKLGLRVNDKAHYHNLGEDFFLQVIDGLDNVTEAYRGTKNADNPSRRENYFLLISKFKDKNGDTINVPVYIDEHADVNKVFIDVNKISTVFGKENLRDYINTQMRKGNLVRIKRSIQPSERYAPLSYDYGEDTSTASNEVTTSGLQLPHVVQPTLDANNSISNSNAKNNSQNAQSFSDETEQFSYNSQNDKIDDVVERFRNGEITIDELKTLLKKPEGDDPVKIANLKKEDMGSTPPLNKKTTGKVGDSDSRFARSVEKSKIFDEKFKEEVNDDNFVKHYASITNKETLAEAANRLDEGGEAYVNEWFNKKAVHMDTVDTMVGFILLKRYQDAGNYRSAAAIAQKVREVGTLSGQRVQVFSIIGRFDADMMQVYAQKELDKAWEFAKQSRSDKWLEKHKEQFNLTEDDISFIRNNILYASNLPENSRERAIALSQITSLIQSKIPPIRGQSYKAWQRISMLLNPKTQIRNIAGNALMAPVFVASDWFSTPIDYIISKKTGVRTTGLTGIHGNKDNFKAMGKGIYESFDDWKHHINTKAAEQNRFEIGEGKSFDETKWGRIAKIMNGFDRFTAFLLDAGDRPFYELWFTNSLNEQMRLNKVSEPTEEMVQIAVDEALSRTWQDENRMTKLVSGIKKACNQIQIAGYGLGDVIVKFTKTPANLTKAIYDFSPAAIVTITPQAIRLAKAIKNGTATPSMQKKFVSNFGKMAAGTMLYVAFAALYAAGHITGSSDDDDDVAAFEKYIQGMPEYSIKIGDTWFSYDWAQPIGAVPAIIAEYMEAKDAGGKGVDNLLSAFKAGGEVLFNQSFMSSFQTLFSTNGFSEGMLDLALGEVTVPVPTVFSQLANVLDDKRRVTYDSTSEVKSAVNRAMLKIPGLRNMLEAEVDVLGREVENSQKNWFNAFFNPANVYTDTSSDVTDHAYEIYQSTKDVGAIPAKAPYSVTLQGKTVKLDDAQRTQYQKAMGEAASDLIEILLENDVYKAMSDQEKLSVLKQVYSYSAAVAKNQLEWADDFEVISGIAPYITEKNYDAMSYEERYKIVEDYIFSDYEGMENIESDIGQSNFLINKKTSSLVLEATLAGDMDTAVKLINGIDSRVESYGWSESDAAAEIKERKTSVKTTITRYWKAAYLYAYYSDNKDEQEKIKNMLVEIGLYGNKYDVKKTLKEWVENSENDS